jgi:hypothetical protein
MNYMSTIAKYNLVTQLSVTLHREECPQASGGLEAGWLHWGVPGTTWLAVQFDGCLCSGLILHFLQRPQTANVIPAVTSDLFPWNIHIEMYYFMVLFVDKFQAAESKWFHIFKERHLWHFFCTHFVFHQECAFFPLPTNGRRASGCVSWQNSRWPKSAQSTWGGVWKAQSGFEAAWEQEQVKF